MVNECGGVDSCLQAFPLNYVQELNNESARRVASNMRRHKLIFQFDLLTSIHSLHMVYKVVVIEFFL